MKTIVCYGDSNTYGYNPENGFRYEYEERWTTILQKELKDSAIVIPEGLNGRTTSFEDELRPGRNVATYLDPCLWKYDNPWRYAGALKRCSGFCHVLY